MRKSIVLMGIILVCIYLIFSVCTKIDYISPSSEINQPGENAQTANLPKEEQQPVNDSKDRPEPSNVPEENPQEIEAEPQLSLPADNQDISPESSIPKNMEQFEVAKSANISGWNELKAAAYLYKLEMNSEGMSWSLLPDYKLTAFSLDFPDNWVFNGSSVFYDQDNKVAELVPVAEACITIDEIFQNYKPSVATGEELISKNLLAVNGYQAIRIISKNEIPFWYPHKYFISNGSYIFSMNFYSDEIIESDQQLFDKIISTFRFEDE